MIVWRKNFYGQPSQIYRKKNDKVRVERSPIFKDRFFILSMGYLIPRLVISL
jgi:hypothetical protein